MDTAYSIYLHIPFCKHRCAYCDFNTYAGLEHLFDAYVNALCTEIGYASNRAVKKPTAKTLFFGGGTPSLLSVQHFETILDCLQKNFDELPELEISIEANPGTVTLDYLTSLRQSGINRISFGLQSANPSELRLLERGHTYYDVIQSVTWARKAGFDNLNLDLIYGLPGQTMEDWQRSLKLAGGLHPEHFSLYALTIESGTPFGSWAACGLLPLPDPDLAAEMYEWASDYLSAHQYTQYEISNWARSPDRQTGTNAQILLCKHNLQYWRNLPYLGFGAGAHGYAAGYRTANVRAPSSYLQRMQDPHFDNDSLTFPCTPATQSVQAIDRQAEIGETMMMGLRLTQAGISRDAFQKRFGESLEDRYSKQIQKFTQFGLLEWGGEDQDILRLTKTGRLLGNQVFADFI